MRLIYWSTIAFTFSFCMTTSASNWSTYRSDAGRSAYTSEEIPSILHLQWKFEPRHPPVPAWPSEPRMTFDHTFHVVASASTVFWGHSVEGKIYALDAASGQERWTFFTEGPVRFAPTLWKDRLFAVSDDGHLYCLAQADGKLIWKKRLAPGPEKVMGNGQLISKWPARGGPFVLSDIVYVGAGIWPSEGIYISAWNAESGEKIWGKDRLGSLTIDQPHKTAKAKSGISCQGYLATNNDALFIPTGRAVPAALNRSDGKFLYYNLAIYNKTGGASLTAFDHMVCNQGIFFNSTDSKTSRRAFLSLPRSLVTVTPDTVILFTKKELLGMDRVKPFKITKRKTTPNVKWRIKNPNGNASAMIGAGKHIVVGGKGYLRILESHPNKKPTNPKSKDTHPKSTSLKIEGEVKGLAYAHGRLYVSTERGHIYCFGANVVEPTVITQKKKTTPTTSSASKTATEILKSAEQSEGYALDLECGNGQLTLALALQSKLKIFAVSSNPKEAAAARKRLDEAGLYGARTTVFLVTDPADTGFPKDLADVVFSAQGRSASKGFNDEMIRCAKPFGGVVCKRKGKLGTITATSKNSLKGIGIWTHQYANAGNTACSNDSVVRGELTIKWFDDFGQVMPSRHGRAPAPLYMNGRMFVLGVNELRAFDVYNGRALWALTLEGIAQAYDNSHWMGTATTGGVFCLGDRFIYLRSKNHCLQIDQKTGSIHKTIQIPATLGKNLIWGYIAFVDGRLYGSVADKENQNVPQGWREIKPSKAHYQKLLSQSSTVFAWDVNKDQLLWHYQAQHSIRHNAIAIGKDTLYLIDRPKATFDNRDIKDIRKIPAYPSGELLGLNATDGKKKWSVEKGITGTMLCLSLKYDILLMANQPTRGALPSERRAPRLTGFNATTGKRLYGTRKGYRARPIIVDRTIYAEPGAWDLVTGKLKRWQFKRSYGCGLLAAGQHILTFRSATFGYATLDTMKPAIKNFGGVRPGCWMNAIPAGGLVLIPDGTSQCKCSYQMATSLVLEPKTGSKD